MTASVIAKSNRHGPIGNIAVRHRRLKRQGTVVKCEREAFDAVPPTSAREVARCQIRRPRGRQAAGIAPASLVVGSRRSETEPRLVPRSSQLPPSPVPARAAPITAAVSRKPVRMSAAPPGGSDSP